MLLLRGTAYVLLPAHDPYARILTQPMLSCFGSLNTLVPSGR